MNGEKIYPRIFSKKDKKDANAIGYIFVKGLISSLILIVLAYILDEVMKVEVSILLGVIYIWLAYIVIVIINSIRRTIKFNRDSRTYIITNKSTKEIMIYYANSLFIPPSANLVAASHAGRIVGGNVGTAVQGTTAVAIHRKTKKLFNTIDVIGIPANLTIENILNDPKFNYEYYKNVSLLNETNNYFLFRGTNVSYTNVETVKDFKIFKKYNNLGELKDFNE